MKTIPLLFSKWPVLAAASMLAIGSCSTISRKSLQDTAYDYYSIKLSCPDSRMHAQTAALTRQDMSLGAPPSSVSADVERLATWKKNEIRRFESYRNLIAIDVSGCDAHQSYFCWYQSEGKEADPRCLEVPLTDPTARLLDFRFNPGVRESLLERLHISANK